MRALVAAIVLVLTVTVASASGQQTPPSSYGEAVFLVSGRGYGHGVGMSQYGAYGQALAGRTYDQILAHYYTGNRARESGQEGGARSPRRRSSRGDDLVEPPVHRRRRDGGNVSAPQGTAHGSPRSLHPLRSRPGSGDPAARVSAGQEGIARARRSPLPRQARARPAGRVPSRGERRRARELHPGRGRGGDALQLARRGAQVPGGRCPLVRACQPRQGEAVRPLLGRPQPGVPRRGR